MSAFVLLNTIINYDGRNISGVTSQVTLDTGVDLQEDTAFGDTYRTRLAGLFDTSFAIESYWEAISASDSFDADVFGSLNAGVKLLSVSAEGGPVGDVSYMFEGDLESYNMNAVIGEIFKVSITIQGNDRLMRGTVMENGTRAATGNGTIIQVGAVSATQTIYSGLHVTAASGSTPTLDVTVESDPIEAFTTATLRITHAQLGIVGSELLSLAGPVTDARWRGGMTMGGGGPSFTAYHTLAILPTAT